MKVLIAGGTGALGKFLVPQLVENGHEVVALARAEDKAKALEAMGAKVVSCCNRHHVKRRKSNGRRIR